ncbi:MAG TPA: hypothetical protein VKX49_23805 [Bryobacteraceae bacterium]|nr:hypothetical protein [Bryobacteraceae bacterium]
MFVEVQAGLESGALSSATFPKETWRTNRPTGLILLGHGNEGYKRISITPSPEFSLATIRLSDSADL